jgi:regulatory protein
VGSAYSDALRLLAGRELSAAEIRSRLLDRDHPRAEVDAAIEQLIEAGSLDDGRVARACARTALNIKGRGRLRIARELREKGIAEETVTAAIADVVGDLDERTLVARAIEKKLKGRPRPADRAAYARLYQHLMRQGFSPAAISSELRKLQGRGAEDE